MKSLNFIFLSLFLFTLISCQSTKKPSAAGTGVDAGEENAGDVAGGSSEAEEDLDSEFADSEDFESELGEKAFPKGEDSEGSEDSEKQTADNTEDEDSGTQTADNIEDEDSEDLALGDEDSEEELTDEEDIESADSDEEDSSVVINNIRYSAGENRIYIEGTQALSYQSRENSETKQFIIEVPNAVLSESLRERPFVMKDFDTDMIFLQADQKDSDTVRIVIQMRENAGRPSVNVSDTGSLVVAATGEGGSFGDGKLGDSSSLSEGGSGSALGASNYGEASQNNGILPAKSLEDFFLTTPKFTGRPISIHLKDVSVKDVLYFISEGTGLNMVIADDVSGTISIKLRNVPWDQALVTVMKTKKLGYLREGNVIRIMSFDSLRKDQEDIQKMLASQKTLDPLKIKVIPLIYAKADDMVAQVKEMSTEKRGKVTVDKQSNSLIVTDTTRVIDRMEVMIKNLDKTPLQVMIEAKIVEARESFVRNLGLSIGYEGAPLNIVPGGNPQLALDMSGGLQVFPGGAATAGRTATAGLQVGYAPIGNLDVQLGLSEAEDLIHVISAPRIMVLNGEKAKITQSTQSIDINTTFPEGGGPPTTSPTRVDATLDFDVSPQVTALGSVFMEIKMKRDFFGPPSSAGGSRPLNSREASTKVLVNNGQTIVIGGIYQKDETSSSEGLPILKHIPILKWLFSRATKDQNRNELLLFLTPRVSELRGGGESAN